MELNHDRDEQNYPFCMAVINRKKPHWFWNAIKNILSYFYKQDFYFDILDVLINQWIKKDDWEKASDSLKKDYRALPEEEVERNAKMTKHEKELTEILLTSF